MGTAQPLKAPVREPESAPQSDAAKRKDRLPVPADSAGLAMVPLPQMPDVAAEAEFSAPVLRLPVQLDVAVPVRDFRVRNLLALMPAQVIETKWSNGIDLPLAAGEVRLAWCEFEVLENRLAVRVTRVA